MLLLRFALIPPCSRTKFTPTFESASHEITWVPGMPAP